MEMIGVKEAERAEKYVKDTMQFIYDILVQLTNKQKYADTAQNKVTKDMLKHIKKGGEVHNMMVPVEDTQLMQECMNRYHVIFLNIENPKKACENDGQTVFLFKDNERKKVEMALALYRAQKGLGSYINETELLEQNEGKNINVIAGLNTYELEVFKKHSKEELLTYSIKKNNETHEFEILVPDTAMEKASNILNKTVYETSGKEGEELVSEIEQYFDSEKQFREEVNVTRKNDVVYIVDMLEPSKYISVQKEQYAIHFTEQDQNGNLYDNNTVVKEKSIDNLMKYVSSMNKPVVVSEKEMILVNNIDSKGNVSLPEKKIYDENYKKLKKSLKDRKDYYRTDFKINKEYDSAHIYKYQNLSEAQCQAVYMELKRQGIDNAFVYNSTLAFTEDVKGEVDNILNDVLYTDMSELEKAENEMYYQGRGQVLLSEVSDTNQYIIDADSPENVICIDENGFILLVNGTVRVSSTRNSEQYANFLLKSIHSFSNPICLNEEEKNSPEQVKIIQSKIPYLQHNEASEVLNAQLANETILDVSYKDGFKQRPNHIYTEREMEAIEKLQSRISVRKEMVEKERVTKTYSERIDHNIRDAYENDIYER